MRNAGSKRLEAIATSNVIESKFPEAVPPKLEAENMKKPKNSMTAVYTILTPVSRIVMVKALDILITGFDRISCRYLVRK
jgi:hypothetical protein